MARKKQNADAKKSGILDPDGPGMIKAIQRLAVRKLNQHWDSIVDFRKAAEDNKVKVTLGVTIDYDGSDPQLDISIRFSQAITDSAKATVTDAKQGTFTEVEAEAEQQSDETAGVETEEDPNENGD